MNNGVIHGPDGRVMNADEFRHEPKVIEDDTALSPTVEAGHKDDKLDIFGSSGDNLVSIKINGIPHAVRNIGEGYYHITSEVYPGSPYQFIIFDNQGLRYVSPSDNAKLLEIVAALNKRMEILREKNKKAEA